MMDWRNTVNSDSSILHIHPECLFCTSFCWGDQQQYCIQYHAAWCLEQVSLTKKIFWWCLRNCMSLCYNSSVIRYTRHGKITEWCEWTLVEQIIQHCSRNNWWFLRMVWWQLHFLQGRGILSWTILLSLCTFSLLPTDLLLRLASFQMYSSV